jgi:RNA polymerase sigma factor (sigma-70 family)
VPPLHNGGGVVSCERGSQRSADHEAAVLAWRDAEPRALLSALRSYDTGLHRYFRRRTRIPPDDLVQETLLAILRGVDRFEHRASFSAYVFAVAKRVLRREQMRYVRDRQRFLPFETIEEKLALPSTDRVDAGPLLAGFERLSSADRVLLRGYYGDGLSGPEMAARLQLTEPTMRSRLRRAVERFRSELHADAAPAPACDTSPAESLASPPLAKNRSSHER